jgi:inosine-uridine nucleoside N-ribohydrolase
MVQQYGSALTVIALGPLTNIARAMQAAPQTMQQLGRLVIMGGAIAVPGNISPVAEFNIYVDPHAADIVFQSGIPITLIPLDVTQQVRLTPDLLSPTSRRAPTPLAQTVRDLTQHAFQKSTTGMALHDPLAVAVALDPSLVTCTALPVRVETRGTHTLGMTVADRRASVSWSASLPRLDVALEVHASRVLDLCVTRLLT